MDNENTLRLPEASKPHAYAALHPGCDRCGVEVCTNATDDARARPIAKMIRHNVDCLCGGMVPGGISRDGFIFCGDTCDEAHASATPVPVVDPETAPVDVAASVPAVKYERAMVSEFWKMGGGR
jgi:hypothetical protein